MFPGLDMCSEYQNGLAEMYLMEPEKEEPEKDASREKFNRRKMVPEKIEPKKNGTGERWNLKKIMPEKY